MKINNYLKQNILLFKIQMKHKSLIYFFMENWSNIFPSTSTTCIFSSFGSAVAFRTAVLELTIIGNGV